MAKRVFAIETNLAWDSLLEIVCHIQLNNPAAAQRFASKIKTKAARLKNFPESGRIITEFHFSG